MIRRIPTPYSYSSAVITGEFVFLGLHRGFGESFNEQIHDTFLNLKKTLSDCGISLDSLVKVNVFLKNISDLPEMEKVFHTYFDKDKFPARMTSTTDFIDSDCLMMMDGIAHIPLAK